MLNLLVIENHIEILTNKADDDDDVLLTRDNLAVLCPHHLGLGAALGHAVQLHPGAETLDLRLGRAEQPIRGRVSNEY